MNFSVSNNSTQSLGYFQKLTCSSISVSFNHFRDYKAEMLSKINLKKSRYEQNNVQSVMPTDEERLQIHKENLIQQFKRVDSKQPIYDFGDILFNWLVKRKEIKKETFDSFGEKAILEWERFKKTQARSEYNIKQLKDIEFMTNKRKNFIIDYCKQQSIKNYLASIKDRQNYLDTLKITDL